VLLGCGVPGFATGASAALADVPTPPNVPAALYAPTGAKLFARFHAMGAQVYACAGSVGQYGWLLQRPDATLLDASGAVAGTHGAGPTWTSKDGSSVLGKKVEQSAAPDAGAVPWLLLRAASTSGPGQFRHVTYVQRVDTKGGMAPVTGCDATHVGSEVRVSYSAGYYFYSGGVAKPKKPWARNVGDLCPCNRRTRPNARVSSC
jgi:Protein of unknown function (DUF3455)